MGHCSCSACCRRCSSTRPPGAACSVPAISLAPKRRSGTRSTISTGWECGSGRCLVTCSSSRWQGLADRTLEPRRDAASSLRSFSPAASTSALVAASFAAEPRPRFSRQRRRSSGGSGSRKACRTRGIRARPSPGDVLRTRRHALVSGAARRRAGRVGSGRRPTRARSRERSPIAELEIAYPVGDGRYVGRATGARVDVDRSTGSRRDAASFERARQWPFLIHRPGLLDDAELVEQVTSAARLALEQERLQASAAQEDDLRASRGADRRVRRHRASSTRARPPRRGAATTRRPAARGEADAHSRRGQTPTQPSASSTRSSRSCSGQSTSCASSPTASIRPCSATKAWPPRSTPWSTTPPHRCASRPSPPKVPGPVEHAAYRVVAEAFTAGATRVRALRRDSGCVVEVDTWRRPRSRRARRPRRCTRRVDQVEDDPAGA